VVGPLAKSIFLAIIASFAMLALPERAVGAPVVEVVPAAPRSMEPVYVRMLADAATRHGYSASVSVDGSSIVVQFVEQPDSPAYDYDVSLGNFAPGSYNVQVVGDIPGRQLQFNVATQTDAVPATDSPLLLPAAPADLR
jgi:hypothetical protein